MNLSCTVISPVFFPREYNLAHACRSLLQLLSNFSHAISLLRASVVRLVALTSVRSRVRFLVGD